MNNKMTLREFFAIALPEVVPNLSDEERLDVLQRYENGTIGRPDIDELADLHALDEFNIQRSYDILEVMEICKVYEKCLDLYSMSGDEGNLIWQKVSDWQDDQSNRHHNLRRNPFKLMSSKSKKAVYRNVGKPCDMVQVLQMFHEAYESEDQCNEDANNKHDLFPILRKRFEYDFKFKVDGRTLTYYSNYSNSLREMMLTDFWFNLRPHWTGIYVKRRAMIEKIQDRDKDVLDKLERGWYFGFADRMHLEREYNKRGMSLFKEDQINNTYSLEDCVYQYIMKACKTLEGNASFSIGEIMQSCVDKAIERHKIIWPVVCRNDMLGTKHFFEMFECYAKQLREIGNKYRKAARFFCIYNAKGTPIPETEGYNYFPQEIEMPSSYYSFYQPYNFDSYSRRSVSTAQYAIDQVVELTKLMQTHPILLKKTLNQTGLKIFKRLEKARANFEELEYRMIHLLPDEQHRELEHRRAMELANRLLELAKGFDAELTQKQVERLHGHIKELESEFVRDKPIEGIEKPSGYDMTECPICGTQFDCSQSDYFHHAVCPICKETMLVLPGMSLWNKLVEAGEEESKCPAEEPEEPVKPPMQRPKIDFSIFKNY